MEEELARFKNKKKKNNVKERSNQSKNNHINKVLIKTLVVIVITLCVLIMSKSSTFLDKQIKKYVFEETFNFSKYMSKYNKYFSEFMPFENFLQTETVFNEKLEYNATNKYLDGVELTVSSNYLVPCIESGLVVFIGVKEGYGNVAIIQQVDGVDTWYGNLENIAVNLYDYVEIGSLIGEAKDNSLYLVLEKEGQYLNYEEYS